MYLLLLQMAYNINGINSQINFTERNYLLSMKKLVIYRKKQFPSALMPYWIVTDISKSELMEKHQLSDEPLRLEHKSKEGYSMTQIM